MPPTNYGGVFLVGEVGGVGAVLVRVDCPERAD